MKLNPKYYEIFESIKDTPVVGKLDLNSNVLLIDGLNTFIRCWSVVPNLNENGEHVGGVTGFLKSIGYAIRELNPTRTIIVFDGRNSSSSKKKIYSEYKSNRGKNKLRVNRGIYEQLSDEDEEESKRRQIVLLAEILQYLPVTVMMYESAEADDVMAYISKSLCQEHSIIMSTDKDFLQLVDDSCMVWSPMSQKLYTKELIYQEYGIPSHNFLLYRIMDGDKSDNISGISGAGLTSIKKRLPIILSENVQTVDDVIRYAENKAGKIKLYDSIIENKDVLHRNYELMQLDDVNLRGQLKLQIQDRFREEVPALNKSMFIRILGRERMTATFKDPIGWLTSTFNSLDSYRKNG